MPKFNFQLPNLNEVNFLLRNRRSWIALIIMAILLISIPLGAYLVQNIQIFKPRASNTPPQGSLFTQDARSARDSYIQAVDAGNPQAANIQFQILKDKLKTREKDLLNLAYENPAEFLKQATLADEVATFPEGVRSDLEQRVTVTGTVYETHSDDFENNRTEYSYTIQSQDNQKRYEVIFTSKPKSIINSNNVTLNGTAIDTFLVTNSNILESSINSNLTPELPKVEYPTFSKGIQNVIVYMLNFQDDTSQPISKNDLEILLQRGGYSSSKYLENASYSKLQVNFDVQDWYTLNIPSRLDDGINCSSLTPAELKNIINGSKNLWDSAGIKRYLEQSNNGQLNKNHQHLVFFYPRKAICGKYINSYANMNPRLYYNSYEFRDSIPSVMQATVFAYRRNADIIDAFNHELGHTLGLNHADMFDACPAADQYQKLYFVDIFGRCLFEYADKYDTMGTSWENEEHVHFNAPHRLALGVFGPNQFKIMSPGTEVITLYGLDTNDDRLKTVAIPKNNTGSFLFVQYRNWESAIFNTHNPPAFSLSGIYINESGGPLKTYSAGHYLIKDEPASLTKRPHFLTGDIFTDPANGITVEVFEVNRRTDSATVKITYTPTQISQPPTSKSISNILLGVADVFGAGSLSCSLTGRGAAFLNCATIQDTKVKDNLCNGKYVESEITVEYSDGTQLTPKPKIRIVGNNDLCGSSTQAGGAGEDTTVRNLGYTCLNNGRSVQLRWDPSQHYDLRMDADPDNPADGWNGTCSSPAGDQCANNILNGFDANINPNTKYRWWVHSLNADKTENSAVYGPDFTCAGTVEDLPTNLSATCSNNLATLSWNGNFSKYKLRVDAEPATDGWTGCSSLAGDFCDDNVRGNTYLFGAYKQSYNWWIHGITPEGRDTSPARGALICPVGGNTRELVTRCAGNGNLELNFQRGGSPYHLRVDVDPINDPWTGCSSPKGDFCKEDIIQRSYNIKVQPNTSYRIWYHGVINGGLTPALGNVTVSCPS